MNWALLVALGLAVFSYQGNSTKTLPRSHNYEVVYPRKLHALHKREVGERQTPDQKPKYEDTVQYEIQVKGEKMLLHLEKNKELFSKDYSETYYSQDGKEITESPQTEDHCYYNGHIQNDTDSAASISACHGLKGYFKSHGEGYLIEPLNLSVSEAHAVFNYESLQNEEEAPTCGVTNTTWQSDDPLQKTSRMSTSAEKQAYMKAKKYIELYIVVDQAVFRKFSRNMTTVRTRVFEIVNYMNVVYKPLNIYIALIGLQVWSDGDKIAIHSSPSVTLEAFAVWRKSLLKWKRNDNAQLLTGIDFSGPTVGLAYMGTMCHPRFSLGIVQDHNNNPIAIGATMAHEMGHNLGMNHDTSFCKCISETCIMAPKHSYKRPRYFSSCSLQDYQKFMMDKTPQCLIDMPNNREIIVPPVCGNDFVEEGEECDCGSPEECKNDCCDAATCKLKPGANCGYGECCENCKLKRAGAVCRPVKNDCDLPEQCTGHSPFCPMDRFRINGHPCLNNESYCFMGKCPTLKNQCTDLWGPGAKVATDSCFAINRKGVYYGHCRKENGTYVPCEKKDQKCGKLYCTGGSRMPTTGSLVTFDECKGSFPSEEQEDGGMVSPGTKCGQDMVCSNGECVDVGKAYRSTNCSDKCKGHAVCDHELQCQCKEGWLPPNCNDPTENRYTLIIIATVLVALAVAALVAAVLFYFYIIKKRQSQSTHKGAAGASNLAFSVPDQKRKQHLGPGTNHTESNSSRSLLPSLPPQAAKPPVKIPDRQASHVSTAYQNDRMPIVKPNIPPPPVPTTQSSVSPATAATMIPVPSPQFKSRPAPPSPPQAIKPPNNFRV